MNATTSAIAQLPDQPSPAVAPPATPPSVRRLVVTFLTLVYAGVTAISLALPGTIAEPGPAPLVAIFVPALVVGMLTALRRRRPGQQPFGLRRIGLTGIPIAIVLPVLAVGGPFVIADLLGIVRIVDLAGYFVDAPINLALLTFLVMGEEIGWRGFMLPLLSQQMSPKRASLVTGFAQGLFHLPLILLTSSYDSAGNRVFVAVGAVAVITCGGMMFGWLRLRTGSLWPVAIAHAMVNVCIIESPYLTSRDLDVAAYFTGEAGLFTMAGTALVALGLSRYATWTPQRNG